MKILYGVQGTGNGHTTRARVMAKAFKQRGVEVDFVFSGREKDKYFDMEDFGDYRCFQGLTFSTGHGKVNYIETIRSARLLTLFKDIKSLDVSGYDLIINDFEPVTAWAAKLSGKQVINISHQVVFTNDKVPSKGLSFLNKQILKYFAPCNIMLGVHWFHYGQLIIPPFIEREEGVSDKSDDILVYMPFEDVNDISELLKGQHNVNFTVYHPEVSEDKKIGPISYKKPCRKGFLQDLDACTGVIANAGFELSSEALCSGKKLLLKPLEGQFEQASNAETLKQLGLANVMSGLDDNELDAWLIQPQNEAINYPKDPKLLIDWLLSGDYSNPQELVKLLWQPISLPPFSYG